MNIDEMKDRIARAEEIQRYTENRCEALEKENADLERKLEQTEKDLADYQFNYSTIKELEKENAELRENNQFLNNLVKEKEQRGLEIQEDLLKENAELKARLNAINLLTPELQKRSKLKTQQLTKAKEIIRALLKHTYGQNLNTQNDFDLYLGRIKEAEQFLSEVK